jgi:hypothetical protein
MLHRQQQSSGTMTSTSSLSPRSTHNLMEGGGLTTLVGLQSHHQHSHTLRWWRAHRWRRTRRQQQASSRPISGPSSSAVAQEKTAAPSSSASARGATTSMVTTALHKPLLRGMPRIPLLPQYLGVDARRLPRTSEWWSSHISSGLTCRRSTTGPSTPLSSCRSTPPPSFEWWSGHISSGLTCQKKYDGIINPAEFLQIYTTSILADTQPHGGRWANHFHGSPKPSQAQSRTLMAMCTSMAPRTPTAASLTTTDLRSEFEHRCLGEDGYTIIERWCERRRNLNGDYGTAQAAHVEHAAHTPTSPGYGGGCTALAPLLRVVVWPRKFWPHLSGKYGGTVNPVEFLQIYTTSILADRHGQLFPCGPDQHVLVVAHEPSPRVLVVLGRVVPSVHNQL